MSAKTYHVTVEQKHPETGEAREYTVDGHSSHSAGYLAAQMAKREYGGIWGFVDVLCLDDEE